MFLNFKLLLLFCIRRVLIFTRQYLSMVYHIVICGCSNCKTFKLFVILYWYRHFRTWFLNTIMFLDRVLLLKAIIPLQSNFLFVRTLAARTPHAIFLITSSTLYCHAFHCTSSNVFWPKMSHLLWMLLITS